ncbi:MAG: extracellular solute-binding protein [Chloroflexota bacterium]|nr:extracellular solute-binding protein [Chloroflexota bacterium]
MAAVADRRPDFELQVSHVAPSPSGLAELIAAARRGGEFDLVAGVPGTQLSRLAREGLVLALNAWLGGLDLLPAMERLGQHHQARIGLPLSGYPVYGFINPQAFERAAVTEPGATYQEWLDTARRLTDRERFSYGWGVVADVPEIETVATSAGGRFWTGAQVAPSAGWQWYADLIHREAVSPPPYAWDGLLGAHHALVEGRIAMTIRSAWLLDELPNGGPWQLVPLPAWGDHRRAAPVAADYVAVAHDAENVEAAVDVASLLATEAWPARGARGLPAWRPALEQFAETTGISMENLTEAADDWRRPSLEVPGAEIARSRILPAIDDVMSAGQPVEARMTALAEELQALDESGVG